MPIGCLYHVKKLLCSGLKRGKAKTDQNKSNQTQGSQQRQSDKGKVGVQLVQSAMSNTLFVTKFAAVKSTSVPTPGVGVTVLVFFDFSNI